MMVLQWFRNLWNGSNPEKKDEPTFADTEIVVMPYRMEWITMTYIDYLNTWKFLSYAQKDAILANQNKKLKSGEVEKVFFEGKKYYLSATTKGKVYSDLHKEKQKNYKEL